MKVSELLTEGFSGFSVGDSDSAWDLHYTTEEAIGKERQKLEKKGGGMLPDNVIDVKLCEVAIKELRKGLKDKGNAYNTHGTLNVAMILEEKFHNFRKYDIWKSFALEVATKLKEEMSRDFGKEYLSQMLSFAHAIETWAKKASPKK